MNFQKQNRTLTNNEEKSEKRKSFFNIVMKHIRISEYIFDTV